MCEPTFEEWFDSFAGELARLSGELPDFDATYDRYFPAYENGMCGGTCARHVAGAEQTNIDFFQVTKIIGSHMVEVCAVSQISADKGDEPWMTGKVVPKLDAFTGKPMRRRVNGRSKSVRIDNVRTAFLWDGRPLNWTGYA